MWCAVSPARTSIPARLGGPEPHSRRSGVVHVVTPTHEEALAQARRLALLLGRQGTMDPALAQAVDASGTDLAGLLPDSPRRAYDVHPLVAGLLDEPGVELHPRWAPNVVTELGRLGGRTVGVLANNPLRLGGCLDATSAEKAARFVRMCDAFGAPLVVLVDVPGYLPGVSQEWDGVVRRGAKLLHAFAECRVPRVTLVTRKAYGGAYIAMNSRALGATRVFAWPDAEVAVMGAVAAVRILHRRTLAGALPGSGTSWRPSSRPSTRRSRAGSPARSTSAWWTRSSSPAGPAGRSPPRSPRLSPAAGRTATSRCEPRGQVSGRIAGRPQPVTQRVLTDRPGGSHGSSGRFPRESPLAARPVTRTLIARRPFW